LFNISLISASYPQIGLKGIKWFTSALIIMTNNDNGESIFKELLNYPIGDTFTPWQWGNYIPYDMKN